MELHGSIDPKETALLVIDMQNGFCHDDGGLKKGGLSIEACKRIIPTVRSLIEACHEIEVPVIFSQQEHFLDDHSKRLHRIPTHLNYLDVRNLTLCIGGTWDAEILGELKAVMRPGDPVIKKHKFSCFYATRLEALLRALGRRLLIHTGVNTNVCVESTFRDAYMRDFDVIVVEDAVAGPQEHLHRATLENVRYFFGAVMTSQEVMRRLGVARAVVKV